jgi:ubiquinone/menaquinone biosynthesis C-methylase UbiE
MGFYDDQIVPRILNFAMAMPFIQDERKKCLTGVHGRVLEVGFGSGHNLPFYPEGVEKIMAVDPSEVSAKLAKARIAKADFPVEYLTLKGEEIPAPDASFDTAVSTFTLCSIPDAPAALKQIYRVLKPGAEFHFVEHGRSPDITVQRWQDRLNGLQQFICGGCHLNRDIEQLIRASGLEIVSIDKSYAQGPRFASYFYRGTAQKPESNH